ncbi:unnamed protein product, partial [Iphiclides podalirius]
MGLRAGVISRSRDPVAPVLHMRTARRPVDSAPAPAPNTPRNGDLAGDTQATLAYRSRSTPSVKRRTK